MPITRKLILIMVLTSSLAVLIASVIFGVTEGISTRNTVAENLATLADVIGTNSAAAITFEDEDLAADVLMSLAANPEIEYARMFMRDGRVLATFSTSAASPEDMSIDVASTSSTLAAITETDQPEEHYSGLNHLEAVYPIRFDNELIGFLHMRTSLNDLKETIHRVHMLALGTVFLAIVVALMLSIPLQSVISRPIVSLSRLMNRVTSEQDYTLRTAPSGSDELGTLMHGFNAMLGQINTRDEQLAEANSRLKQAIEESIEARDAAVSASRAKSEFLARMSHEIRTPMNGVLGMTELLLTSELGRTERKFAETIQQSGETLLAVINDILDFSKIEAGKLELDDAEFDIAEVVESIVSLLYSTAHRQGVDLIADVCPTARTTVRGDAVRLRQILMNLVGNAIKFTHDGQIVVRLSELGGAFSSGGFRFEVEDSGIGIDNEQQASIFASFTQADVSTTRQYGGTGLGLAISRQLVELMGGQIGVQSRRGDGSTFWFTANLPVVINPSEPARTDPEALSGIRVLVVDDNETNREILLRQLKYWNVEVVTSSGAAEAIEILQDPSNRRFDIVLLDYFMPETDGLELAAAIRSRPDFGNPGLIMLSSAGPEFNSATVREFGIDLYLSKPVRRQDLQASIVRVLEGLDDADYDLFSVITAKHVTKASLGLNVLLVEDIAVNLQVAQHMLASIGCRSAAAGNGQEALDLMERNDFDLVLMDCQMPVMDGFTATCEQRAREQGTGKRLPIIALTANALEEDRQHCIDAGMDDFISKPFNRETLIDVLSRWGAAEAPTTDQVTGDTEATAAYGAIERATLEQIADLDPDNGGVLVGRIIDTYLQDSAALVEQLAAATRNGDAAEAARIAHALKSSSANVGAKRLSGMCRTIEAGARSGRLETIAVEFSKASDEYDTVVVELRQTKDELVA